MHSMPVAEPIGVTAGAAGGILVGTLVRLAAKKTGAPFWLEVVCGTTGAVVGHYAASASVKLAVNAVMLDPIGAGLNLTITSPVSSIMHGVSVFNGYVNWW